jgi:hypothetical protein
MERYVNGETTNHNYKKPTLNEFRGNAFAKFNAEKEIDEVPLPKISNLPDDHFAKVYVKNRKIPTQYWSELYFTDKFKTFLDSKYPEYAKETLPDDARLVLLYTNSAGEITNIAGRALSDSKIRYAVVKVSDEPKVFGTHRVNLSEKVFVTEGQIDSLFLTNCIASGDSNLTGTVDSLGIKQNSVLIYDNEPRNKEIVKLLERSIDANYSVVIFPETLKEKDINEMILSGKSSTEIQKMIEENTFSGAAAKLKFVNWKRC